MPLRVQCMHLCVMMLVVRQYSLLLSSCMQPPAMGLKQSMPRYKSRPSASCLPSADGLALLDVAVQSTNTMILVLDGLVLVTMALNGLVPVPMVPACCMRSAQHDSRTSCLLRELSQLCSTHAYLQAYRAAPHLAGRQHVAGRSVPETTWTTHQVQKRRFPVPCGLCAPDILLHM